MTDAWDGRPQNPERDGWHWPLGPDKWCLPEPHFWCGGVNVWRGHGSADHAVSFGMTYLGPCLTPDALSRALALARDEEREVCVERMQEEGVFGSSGEDMKERLIDVVRARGKEVGGE